MFLARQPRHFSCFDCLNRRREVRVQSLSLGGVTCLDGIIAAMRFTRQSQSCTAGSRARLVIGGLPPKEGPLSEGYYAIPTIFANVANDWRLAREEIFGPVLVAIPWTDEADAIRMANDSHY